MFPRILLLFVLLVISPIGAQERVAAQPFHTASDVTNPALLQKVSYLQQMNKVLKDQLQACQNGETYTGDLPAQDDDGFDAPSAQSQASSGETHHFKSNFHTAANSSPPPRYSTTGVYQQPSSEPKLSCEDYSLSYFRRHPAMAAVCGVNAQAQPSQPAEVASPTVPVSVTRVTSVTAPR